MTAEPIFLPEEPEWELLEAGYDPDDPALRALIDTDADLEAGIIVQSRWSRVDLTTYIGLPAETPDIAGVFYCGRRHLISGPGEAMKTWLCQAAAAAEVKAGRGVIWADLDGMGPRDTAARLIALGVTKEQVENLVYFTNPEGPLDEPELEALLGWAASTSCRLFVADAFTGFLVAHDLDGHVGRDVEKAWQRLDPLLAADIAVVLIDHVVKVPNNRGHAIGSERKGTAAHLHFDLKSLETLARGGTGRSCINVSRDRGAYFPRPSAGELVVRSDADTGAITWTIKPPTGGGDRFRPTHLMEKISRYLERTPDARKGQIEKGVDGKTEYIRLGVDILVDEGYVSRDTGAHGALIHNVIKPFREAEDDLAPTSPQGGTT